MRIRQGNDFIFLWAIERNGEPEDFSNALNIKLHFKNYDCIGEVKSFQIVDGNIVRVEVSPEWASRLGAYRLILSYEFENHSYSDGDQKCVVDVLAFNIVPKTSEADDVTEMAKTTDIMIGLKGDKGDSGVFIGSDEPTNPEVDVWIDTDDEEVVNIENMVNTTYSNLINLRNNKQLIPGIQYRITDYSTTTVQENTQSAGHQFDIIVTADDVDKLNENARAVQRAGDTYFANSKLEAWQVWYSLDNDTSRFAWADTEDGKGVIYEMIDENNNECPYDFKNIMFKRALSDGNYDPVNGDETWVYTFTWVDENMIIQDLSIVGQTLTNDENKLSGIYGNKILSCLTYNYIDSESMYALNDNVFISSYSYDPGSFYGCYSNTFGNDCRLNTFGDECYSNTFGDECYSNTFGSNCQSNTFGNNCRLNTFGDNCRLNTFGNDCQSNTFGSNCQSNTFGNNCRLNTFGDNCRLNTFGNDCQSNTFGNDCRLNTFGNNYRLNTFGNDCHSNTFGNDCHSNTFGNNCRLNTFGDGCYSNTFEYGCQSNTFGNNCHSNTFGNDCRLNTFGDGCYSNTFEYGCQSNTFGNNCRLNTFGANIWFNTFGDECYSNTFGSNCQSNTFGANIWFNTIGNLLKNVIAKNGLWGLNSSNKKDWTAVTALYNKNYPIEVWGYRESTSVATTNTYRYFNATGDEVKGTF